MQKTIPFTPPDAPFFNIMTHFPKLQGRSQPETERAQPSGHWQWHDNEVESIVVVVVPAIVAVFVVVVSIIPIGTNATTTVVARDVVARTGSRSTTLPTTQR